MSISACLRETYAALTSTFCLQAFRLRQHLIPHSICFLTGEFEKHVGCWMGWPDSGNLWRDEAKPAQEQYANIAKAISEFEPLTMFANKGPVNIGITLPVNIPFCSCCSLLYLPALHGCNTGWSGIAARMFTDIFSKYEVTVTHRACKSLSSGKNLRFIRFNLWGNKEPHAGPCRTIM